jgi:superfamily II DNA or RNA helicase
LLILESPTILRLPGYDQKQLARFLTYRDKKVEYEYLKLKKNSWYAERDPEGFMAKLNTLKEQVSKTLVFEDDNGLYTHSGLKNRIATNCHDSEFQTTIQYPESQLIPWINRPKYELRPYQFQSLNSLIDTRHGGVELGTGLGKSYIILHLAKQLGLKTLIMTPSKSIAGQIYKEFIYHFGKRYVGQFFGGKKESNKLFVVAVDRSLSLVKEMTPQWDDLAKSQVFIADESHLCPAVTLAQVCFGLAKNAPYRFFFSGTQMRNDGADLLLEGITGPIVHRMTVKEGVDQGYLAKPIFRMIKVRGDSPVDFASSDANEMTRAHLYYNPRVNQIAGAIATQAVIKNHGPVLILVEEVEQITHLLPHLKAECGFAHGGLNKDNRDKVPPQFHDSDPDALVKRFNEGNLPILVGTSCISTGTDVKRNRTTIYLQGGKSEIQVRQGPVGRSTRLDEGKKECFIYDFDVNADIVSRHAAARMMIYRDVYDSPQIIEV